MLDIEDIRIKLIATELYNDDQYLNFYIDLINKNINNTYVKHESQQHHIIPRYYFNLSNIKVDNSKNNLINLNFKDHILAHYYLAKASITKKSMYANITAISMMLGKLYLNLDDEDFISKLDDYQKMYEETRQENYGREVWNKGLRYHIGPMEQQRKNNISYAAVGRYLNHIWIHKEGENKHIPQDQLQKYLDLSFKLGRNQPEVNKKISESQKANPNRSMLGKHQSDYQKQLVSEMFKGKPKSLEHRKKISENRLGKIKIINDETNHKCFIKEEEFETFKLKGYRRVKQNKN